MRLATLLTHLDRQAYIALVAVSRPDQRDFVFQQVDGTASVEVIAERPSSAWTPRDAVYSPSCLDKPPSSAGRSSGSSRSSISSSRPCPTLSGWLGSAATGVVDAVHQNKGFDLAPCSRRPCSWTSGRISARSRALAPPSSARHTRGAPDEKHYRQ